MGDVEVRVAILDAHLAFAELLASPFIVRGVPTITDASPIDFERIVQFGPTIIVIGMGRRKQAMNRPIASEEDIIGYTALTEVENYPALYTDPILIVGSGLAESDVPIRINYDLFLTLEDEAELYVPKVMELGSKRKSRRKISRYLCPSCKGRLTYSQKEEDLFCPRCGTAVVLIQGTDECLYMDKSGQNRPCKTADLLAPKVEP